MFIVLVVYIIILATISGIIIPNASKWPYFEWLDDLISDAIGTAGGPLLLTIALGLVVLAVPVWVIHRAIDWPLTWLSALEVILATTIAAHYVPLIAGNLRYGSGIRVASRGFLLRRTFGVLVCTLAGLVIGGVIVPDISLWILVPLMGSLAYIIGLRLVKRYDSYWADCNSEISMAFRKADYAWAFNLLAQNEMAFLNACTRLGTFGACNWLSARHRTRDHVSNHTEHAEVVEALMALRNDAGHDLFAFDNLEQRMRDIVVLIGRNNIDKLDPLIDLVFQDESRRPVLGNIAYVQYVMLRFPDLKTAVENASLERACLALYQTARENFVDYKRLCTGIWPPPSSSYDRAQNLGEVFSRHIKVLDALRAGNIEAVFEIGSHKTAGMMLRAVISDDLKLTGALQQLQERTLRDLTHKHGEDIIKAYRQIRESKIGAAGDLIVNYVPTRRQVYEDIPAPEGWVVDYQTGMRPRRVVGTERYATIENAQLFYDLVTLATEDLPEPKQKEFLRNAQNHVQNRRDGLQGRLSKMDEKDAQKARQVWEYQQEQFKKGFSRCPRCGQITLRTGFIPGGATRFFDPGDLTFAERMESTASRGHWGVCDNPKCNYRYKTYY